MTIQNYTLKQVERLREMGRTRTSETYLSTLKSFTRFSNNSPIDLLQIDRDLVERYEAWLRRCQLSRNSSSFYMRVLRRIYNMAVEEGLAPEGNPFRMVYTGVDKTPKRAISERDIRRLKELDLGNHTGLAYARDMFMLSFYLRGMSFVDMAYLRKQDLRNGFIIYNRRKTGHRLTIRWERAMQKIVDRYPLLPTQYLLPIILREDGTERRQYLNKMLFVNRKLKVIGRSIRLDMPLSMYVARHSWASIARRRNIPISIISEGMGHESENTTKIYLAAIQNSFVDRANRRIINCI